MIPIKWFDVAHKIVLSLPLCSYRLWLIPHLQVQHWTEKGKHTGVKRKRRNAPEVERDKTNFKDSLMWLSLIDFSEIHEELISFSQTVLWGKPTRLSRPPPRRSIAPNCIPEEGAGGGPVVAGGVRSRLSRSPRRSPWDGMTAGGASVTPAAEPGSGLSTLSPLEEIIQKKLKLYELCMPSYSTDDVFKSTGNNSILKPLK